MDTTVMKSIDKRAFYREYHGHRVDHLEYIHQTISTLYPNKPFVYLAGDSSLDNKYWLHQKADVPAINGYEHVLTPRCMRPDVNYYLNKYLQDHNRYFCINAAVEESTIGARKDSNRLLPQDEFIRNHITNDDILIVSLGGNDIALRPSLSTAW